MTGIFGKIGFGGMMRGFRALCLSLVLGMAAGAFAQADNVPSGSPLSPTAGQAVQQAADAPTMPGYAIQNPYTSQQPLKPFNVSQPDVQLPPGANGAAKDGGLLLKRPPLPGEFEKYVAQLLGRRLPRYGEDLILPSQRDFAAPATATVPPDYIVQPGDVIAIALSGSMEGSVDRVVSTNGTIFLSGVGDIHVAGVRHSDLRDTVARAIGTQFRGFSVSVTIKQLRGIRVYVTGLANNPGAFTVSSLSTLANAVFQAGGPSSGGSWRSIKLYRNGREISDFDLYQLMRGGSRVNDVQLQNEDVLFIPPAGEQVAVVGSVQEEAIYEAKPGESIADMLADAGGPNTLADRSRVVIYHAGDQNAPGPRQVEMAQAAGTLVRGGDIIQVLSGGSLTMPIDRQSVLVRIEGEVSHPGIYYVAPTTPTAQLISLAGGFTPSAYVYGTKFTRQSVKLQQQEGFKEAVRQLELTLASAPLTANSSQSADQQAAQIVGARALLDRLRQAEPDGRVVLHLSPAATAIPGDILLENNDAIYVPPMASTVGVFGAVYRPASFLIGEGGATPQRVKDYVEMAGGTLRAADKSNIFLVRANGEVVSRKRGALNARVLPGDVVFVPVKTTTGSFWAKFKDITQTLFQLGLSAATVVSVTQ